VQSAPEAAWNLVVNRPLPPEAAIRGLPRLARLKEGAVVETTAGKAVFTGVCRLTVAEADKMAIHMTRDINVPHILRQIEGVYVVLELRFEQPAGANK
jgi:hypothetical protein